MLARFIKITYNKNAMSFLNAITQDVSQKVQAILGGRLRKVILFGSYARGDFDEESDVDIMVLADVGKDERIFARKLNVVSSDISLQHDMTVCIMLNDKKLFDERLPILPFYRNVIKDGVEIYAA